MQKSSSNFLPGLAVFTLCGIATAAIAASPAAGTRVLNQAIINYTDAFGQSRQTTTNEVALVVQRVYSATLASDHNVSIAPNTDAAGAPESKALFYHKLVNTGNGEDQFCVSISTDGSRTAFGTAAVYNDVDGDGVVDTSDPKLGDLGDSASLIELSQDEVAYLIVEASAPSGAAEDTELGVYLTVQAQEETGACVTGSVTDVTGTPVDDDDNLDVATVTNDAILTSVKTSVYQENNAGVEDDTILYTISVSNIGVDDATDVTLSDTLPSGTTYIADSIATSGTAFTTAAAHAAGVISGGIATLQSGEVATISFEVALDDTLVAGDLIVNTASAVGNLDGVAGNEDAVTSNEVSDVVPAVRGVLLSDTGEGADVTLNDGGDDNGTVDDDQQVSDLPENAAAIFFLDVTNTGNTSEIFEIYSTSSTFPTGTAFMVSTTGGVPLLDADNDGAPEIIGALDPGDTVRVRITANLPIGTVGGPYSATFNARPDADESISDPADITVNNIIASLVDIAINSGAAFGDDGTDNQDPLPDAANTLTGEPQESLSQPIMLANEGAGPETYLLSLSTDPDTSAPLPADWNLMFNMGDEGAQPLGPVAAGAIANFSVDFTIPEGAGPGTHSFYVTATGSVSGSTDTVRFDVTVELPSTGGLELTPNQNGVISACSAKIYDYRVRNNGTVSDTYTLSFSTQGTLTTTVLLPTSSSGGEPKDFRSIDSLSVGDNVAFYDESAGAWSSVALVSDGGGGIAIPLDRSDWTNIQGKVSANCNTPNGTTDTLMLTATAQTGGYVAQVTSVTTVSDALLSIVKAGTVDTACSASLSGAYTYNTGGLSVEPGECILWKLSVSNDGVEPVCNVTITDGAPAFTSLEGAAEIVEEPGLGAGVCSSTADEISCTVGNAQDINSDGTDENYCLNPGEAASVVFRVRLE